MSHLARLDGIRTALAAHPKVFKSAVTDAKYAERYISFRGMPIVLEPVGIRHNNLWVRYDSLDAAGLADIVSFLFRKPSESVKKPNHDLYTDPLLRGVDLVRYRIRTVGEAERIINALIRKAVAP